MPCAIAPEYVEPAPKSTAPGVNANGYQEGYIWGKPEVSGGPLGYHKLGTPAANEIVLARLLKQKKQLEIPLKLVTLCACCCGEQKRQLHLHAAKVDEQIAHVTKNGTAVLKLVNEPPNARQRNPSVEYSGPVLPSVDLLSYESPPD